MSKPVYLYIDDENGLSETSTINGFNDSGIIDVQRFPLSNFIEFSTLKLELIRRSNENSFDGLIIDLRLDGTGEDRTEFNANAISSELRSVSARNEIKSFPIVLCSTEENIKQTYNADKTSHDLFDYKLSKSNAAPNWPKISIKLLSLAEGYTWIQSDKREIAQIFGNSDLKKLDERIIQKIENLNVIYDFTHFIIKNFFHQTNPLINEKILAARLGIDLKATSSDSWSKLTTGILADIKYQGLFATGWNRWWADRLVDWFNSNTGERLAFLNAEKRVEILKRISGLEDLIVAKPLKYCNSSEFWSICEGYKVPIDPLEGFKIYSSIDLKPWQESKYISVLAILEREGFSDRGLKPHSSEIEKIEYTKELLGIV
ncbi:MAG: hypothetical protein WKF85_00025 [Chitinophagaceae bacterium]